MTLLEHPQAQTLLQDAVLRPEDISDCAQQLQTFVQRYLPCFQRKEQRHHAQTILQGKLTGLQRKTTEPIAHRAGRKRRPLQLFVGAGRWHDPAVRTELRRHVREELGDDDAGPVLLFVAHHDVARPWAAPFGALVSAPPLPLLKVRPLPVMTALIYGPLLVFAGIASGHQRLKRAGLALCAFVVALLTDISRRTPVPGANDNASGVAAVIGLAHDLIRGEPPRSVRVVLLSTGSEETMVEGMHAFLRRHHCGLNPARTLVVCLDQIGWERLVLRESEGVLRRYRTRGEDLELVLDAARRAGVALKVAGPFPTPSDGLAARWKGIPTIFLGSVAANGGYPHYHRPTDLPEHVDLDSVSGARAICVQLVEQLDAPAGPGNLRVPGQSCSP